MRLPLLPIIAYLLGSIPFGYLIVRATQGTDIRQTGSGGTGATNVSRRAGKAAGMLTLMLDALKGAAAIAVAKIYFGVPIFPAGGYAVRPLQSWGTTEAYWWVATAAFAAIIGHIFPVWLGFRGGKGVATGVGVFLMLAPIVVAMAALVFVLVVTLTRYVSLGSILAAIAMPLLLLLQDAFIQPIPEARPLMAAAIAGALLIVFAHRGNIARLAQGRESKFR